MIEQLKTAKAAFKSFSTLPEETRTKALLKFADLIIENTDFLLNENKKDLNEQKDKISSSLFARLKLDKFKITSLAQGIRDIADAKAMAWQSEYKKQLDVDLILERVSVPIGVICVIFESRPDVIPQILALFLKTGNVGVLKGGSEAINSNQAFMKLVKQLNEELNLDQAWASLLETRGQVAELLEQKNYVDLIIPRGSNELVENIMSNTKIPVLGHTEGVCHVYVDKEADLEKALDIVIDSKIQYPSACNAMETLIVHNDIAKEFIESLLPKIKENNISVNADEASIKYSDEFKAVNEWHAEYGEKTFSLKIVKSAEAAIEHINKYGSHHTDVLVSKDEDLQKQFLLEVDSACVFFNASSRFADGYRFGMGAEVGISTLKTHARGPVGLEGLMIYKYILRGDGQIVATYSGEAAKEFKFKDL